MIEPLDLKSVVGWERGCNVSGRFADLFLVEEEEQLPPIPGAHR